MAAVLTDHRPMEGLVAAVPIDHCPTEESEEEHLELDLSPTGSILQRDIILILWTTFMQRPTLRLENIVVPEGPAGQETREAIELLKTAFTQQALYPADRKSVV